MTNWTIRPETPADIEQIHSINAAAFETEGEADPVDALRADQLAWIPGLSLVAVAPDGESVGHVLFTRCVIGGEGALALAPVAVMPSFQRAGAGAALISAGLDAARSLGENSVVVLGHPEYYPRFGFTRASLAGISAPMEVPDEALMALGLDPERPLPSGVIEYAAPFGL